MATVRAIYENGIFRPLDPVELPDHAKVEFEPRLVERVTPRDMSGVHAVLSESYTSGECDVSERHDEHQP